MNSKTSHRHRRVHGRTREIDDDDTRTGRQAQTRIGAVRWWETSSDSAYPADRHE